MALHLTTACLTMTNITKNVCTHARTCIVCMHLCINLLAYKCRVQLPSHLPRIHAGDDVIQFSMHKKEKSGAISTKNSSRCSREFSSSEMMDVLGNRDQYVCNQIRAIRANLSNVSGTTFHTTLVSKTSNVFWINSRSGSKDGLKRRRTHDPATSEGDGQGVEEIDTRQVFANVSGGGGDHNLGGGSFPVESKRRRAKEYTVPHNSRPGQRCASAKAELGDDLLTVVVVIPIRPFDFETRRYLREFLSTPARKLRSRQYYRKIKTSDKPKRTHVFEWYIQHTNKIWGHDTKQLKKDKI